LVAVEHPHLMVVNLVQQTLVTVVLAVVVETHPQVVRVVQALLI